MKEDKGRALRTRPLGVVEVLVLQEGYAEVGATLKNGRPDLH